MKLNKKRGEEKKKKTGSLLNENIPFSNCKRPVLYYLARNSGGVELRACPIRLERKWNPATAVEPKRIGCLSRCCIGITLLRDADTAQSEKSHIQCPATRGLIIIPCKPIHGILSH